MRVLFLDVDGVLNNQTTEERFNGYIGINPVLAKRVQRIVKDTGCKVVLSSYWRLDEANREHVKQEAVEFIDVTPSFTKKLEQPIFARNRWWDYPLRGSEVQHWLKAHPEVTRYAILDDDGDFYDEQPLFQTTFVTGITEEIATKVTEYLNDER